MQFYKLSPAAFPAALGTGAAGCRSYARKKPNFMQFYKIVLARLPRRFGERGRGAVAMLQKSQFYAIL
jgi:hypothetical protein